MTDIPQTHAERAAFFTKNIAYKQRFHSETDPEACMEAANTLHHGVSNDVLEHGGDFLWRMTEQPTRYTTDWGRGAVYNKAKRILKSLKNTYGFWREHQLNLIHNAKYRKIPLWKLRADLNAILTMYINGHAALPAYNEPQRLARAASVAVGKAVRDGKVKEAIQAVGRLLNATTRNQGKWWKREAGKIDTQDNPRRGHHDIKACPKCGYERPRIVTERRADVRPDQRERAVQCQACHMMSGFFPTADQAIKHWNSTMKRRNPRLAYNKKQIARSGVYSYNLYSLSSTPHVTVNAFDLPIPNNRQGAEMFWDAVLTFQKQSMGAAIVEWHRPNRVNWGFYLMRKHLAKKNGIPYITAKAARMARDNARSGKVPRSVRVLEI